MKNITLVMRVLLLPIDLIVVALSISIAYLNRAGVDTGILGFNSSGLVLPLSTYLWLFIISSPLWIASFGLNGLYDLQERRNLIDKLGRIILAVSSAITLTLALLFLTRTIDLSRIVIFNTWWLSIILVFLVRVFFQLLEQSLWQQNVGTEKVAFYGTNGVTRELESAINKDLNQPRRFIGIISNKDIENKIGLSNELESMAQKHIFDELWITDSSISNKELTEISTVCQQYGVSVIMVPHGGDTIVGKLVAEEIFSRPILRLKRTPLEGWNKVYKRVLDFMLAALLLIILSPILLIICVLILIDGPGPVIYAQRRVGEKGEFTFYKFRTMVVGADKEHAKLIKKHGNMFKLKDDPRVTRAGSFLRKTSLDELPQLWNVVKGDMSLVGPRPPLPAEVAKYSLEEKRRLGIKPGITGLWQVSGRSDLTFAEWVILDSYYIENWSLWLDIKILLKTVLVIFKGKGAY